MGSSIRSSPGSCSRILPREMRICQPPEKDATSLSLSSGTNPSWGMILSMARSMLKRSSLSACFCSSSSFSRRMVMRSMLGSFSSAFWMRSVFLITTLSSPNALMNSSRTVLDSLTSNSWVR